MLTNEEGLGKPFGLKGKPVKLTGGTYKGETGIILEETGYTETYGVVCKIKLQGQFGKSGIVEYDHSFFDEL